VLQPLWSEKNPTASKVRGRIENILDWARAKGYRAAPENPARWKGHLAHMLARPSKVHRVNHLEAMPYMEVPAFVRELREGTGIAGRCLELTILSACRVNETSQARWHEIGEAEALWEIPGERTKSGRPHAVPLSPRAMAILAAMKQLRMSEWVFPGLKDGRPLSGMAQLMQLRRMRPGSGLTVHGFRSSFKDWASEQTPFPDFLSEMALGHISGDKVRAAYARSELLAMRRKLMDRWARWCSRRG
jgi:integrase